MPTNEPPPADDDQIDYQGCLKVHISMTAADGRMMKEAIERQRLAGPTEFFRRLLHQGIGAKLPLVAPPPNPNGKG